MFWIFTRVQDNIEVTKPICILKKMPDSQRVFSIFGQMVEKSLTGANDNKVNKTNMAQYEESMDEEERIKMLNQ